MKIKLICLTVLLLSGCQTKYENSLASAKQTVSEFDGSTTINSRISQSWSKSSWMNGGVGFNGFATKGYYNFMVAEVTFINSITNLSKLHLNIDGVFTEYEPVSTQTKVTFGAATKTPMSTRGFIIPVSTVTKIKEAKSIRYRVTTLSDGSREGELVRDGKLSPAAKSLINVAEAIK